MTQQNPNRRKRLRPKNNRPRNPQQQGQQTQNPQQPGHPPQGQQPQHPRQGQDSYSQNPQQPGQPPQGQQAYYPQNPQQPGYPPQGQYIPPPPPANYSQPYPQQQPSQPEKIYVERKSNPLMMILKAIAFPFVKLAQMIANVFTIILQELIRSIVSFVLGIILLIVFVAIVAGYGYALYLTNFNFAAAVPEMFNIFASFFGFGA